ncbi:hypothetical protein ACP70R_030169 [Stipagrostis hirtigluma subsp. patula]
MAAAAAVLLLLAAVSTPPLLAASSAAAGEKEAHIKVYLHDVLSGPDPTAVVVARAAAASNETLFATVVVFDDPLTEGPDLNSSRLVGRAQGTYVGVARDTMTLLMSMSIVFQAGEYNGSTVAVLGRNRVFSAVREMPIVGGTGVFRWARGYVQVRTHTIDLKTGDANLEYNLFIKH